MSLQTASPFLSLYISKYQNIDNLSPTSILSEGDAIDEKSPAVYRTLSMQNVRLILSGNVYFSSLHNYFWERPDDAWQLVRINLYEYWTGLD